MKIPVKLSLVLGIGLTVAFFSFKEQPVLKKTFKKHFYIGAALEPSFYKGKDSAGIELIKAQFNTITPTNDMKWERIHPKLGQFNFTNADEYVKFGEANKMFIIGHCLVWHAQTPNWVFQDSTGRQLTRDEMLARLKDHIFTIMTRYKGRINGYDVVNEALNEDGTYRKSKWYNTIGEDFIVKAFEFASQADPNAELYYNDYNIEQPAKREGAIKIIKSIQEKGIKISGVGIQGHYHLDTPSLKDIEESIIAFNKLGLQVHFTELDINVLPKPENHTGANVGDSFKYSEMMNPYSKGLPDSIQDQLAKRYADFFKIFVKHKDKIERITFWGVGDGDSWLNGWPIRGRTNYPLVFDRKYQPKKAFYSIIEAAKN
jgi:endo-1,4-beta-xylanase